MSFKDKVFLASGSPRRRELITNLFTNISYLKSKLDEPFWQKGQDPKTYLSHCLSVKWEGAKLALKENSQDQERFFLLVADTTVDLNRRLLEKPKDKKDAQKMLEALSGKTHIVRTGLVLGLFDHLEERKKIEFYVESKVTFHTLSQKEIQAYVKSGAPMDKAGAYGFQDSALRFVKELKGSYLNVVGLPLEELRGKAIELGATLE